MVVLYKSKYLSDEEKALIKSIYKKGKSIIILQFDLYIVYAFLSLIVLTIVGIYFSWRRFEIVIFLVAITPWLRAVFFSNIPIWSSEEIPPGLGAYISGAILILTGILGIIKIFQQILR